MIFVVAGLWLVLFTFFYLFGRIEIRLDAGEGRFFKGIGPLGRVRRFDKKSVKSVGIYVTGHHSGRHRTPIYNLLVEMNNGRKITFSHLGKKRETWLAFALNKILGLEQRGAQ